MSEDPTRSPSSSWPATFSPSRANSKTVVVEPDATYFGAPLATNSLVVRA
jgi:hypothetical protein